MNKIFNVLNLELETIAEDKRESVVVSKVEEILAEVDSIKSELNELKVEKDGLEKTVASLEETKIDLEGIVAKYKMAEAEAFEAEVQAVIDSAVEAEKFTSEEDKEFYKENLLNNFEKTKAVIDRIPVKELLTDVINETIETKNEDVIDDIPVV
jgi:polyhydroxyalkanoate synthesis regulator phasin